MTPHNRRTIARASSAATSPAAVRRTLTHALLPTLIALACLAATREATSEVRLFEVDPSRSTLTIDSSSSVTVIIGTLEIPIDFGTQLGVVSGTEGFLMPYGEVSNGLKTSLLGPLLANVTGDSIQLTGDPTAIGLGASGVWAPGPLGDELTLSEGQAAAHLENLLLGFEGDFTLRETVLQTTSPPIALVEVASGAGADQHLDVSRSFDTATIVIEAIEGVADIAYTSSAISGVEHLPLDGVTNTGIAGTGTLVTRENGDMDLEIPVEIRVFEEVAFTGGVTRVDVLLTGSLVAHSSPLEPIAGDANLDGVVNGGDYTIWADNFGLSPATFTDGDFNGDDVVDGGDYTIWADNFGASLDPVASAVMQMNRLLGGGGAGAACGLGFEAALLVPLAAAARRRSRGRPTTL